MGNHSLQPSDSIAPGAGCRRSARLPFVHCGCVHRRRRYGLRTLPQCALAYVAAGSLLYIVLTTVQRSS